MDPVIFVPRLLNKRLVYRYPCRWQQAVYLLAGQLL